MFINQYILHQSICNKKQKIKQNVIAYAKSIIKPFDNIPVSSRDLVIIVKVFSTFPFLPVLLVLNQFFDYILTLECLISTLPLDIPSNSVARNKGGERII